MSREHPELIFVTGPQSGQRVVLSRPAAVLGRGGSADVLLSEEYISRDQVRYELLQAGPTLENLSARGTWINGKRYKSGKRILLETGDLIGVGQTTQILFVAAGDDSDTALAMYREYIATGKDAFGRKPLPEKAESALPLLPEPQPSPDEDEQQSKAEARFEHPSAMSASERLADEQKAHRRKIVIALGAYWAVFVIVVIFILVLRTGKTDGDGPDEPPMLTPAQIAESIRTPVRRTPNQLREEEELKKAVGLYQQYGLGDSYHLYDCFSAFKDALAYNGKGYFDDPEHDRMYREVLDKLTDTVRNRYDNAYLREKAEEWDQAEKEFFEILRIYRDQSGGLFENVQAHYKRVQHFNQMNKPKKRRMFGR